VGYRVKKVPRDQAEIIVCEKQFPRPDHDDRGLFLGGAVQGDFGPFTRLPDDRLRRPGGARARHLAETPSPSWSKRPIQGEAGFLVPRDGISKAAADLAAGTSPLIADEIQTGFGRTGTMFCADTTA